MKPDHQIYIGIGTNINRKFHIHLAITELKKYFNKLIISPVYESPAEGFIGTDFLNLVVYLESNLCRTEVETIFKKIEDQSGRDRSQEKFSSRTLDIDLLLFDDQVLHSQGINVPRDEIVKYAFVLKPLYDIAPDVIHPENKQSIATLWQNFNKHKTPKQISLDLGQNE
ncbi:MAG: 2-amino-4-hydroxy-6-hydroxymethyldihydropteridine diphosphokinase [Pseudomonadota bacterium]